VVRGGSWNNNQINARAPYRNDNHTGNRNNESGLRVVCAAHIFSPLLWRRLGTCSISLLRARPPALPARAALPALSADHGLRTEAKG